MVACWDILSGDCRQLLRRLKARGVLFDSCVCDPPYEINFLFNKWDNTGIAFQSDTWRAVYDVLKPGAHLAAFAGTRTQHRIACAIEDAGFEIRDMLIWEFGVGMPKTHSVGIAIDKMQGAIRPQTTITRRRAMLGSESQSGSGWFFDPEIRITSREAITNDAKKWNGWHTGLRPSLEPITLARKPLESTVAQNVLDHGTGALNIDACRTAKDDWATNLIHDGSDEVEAAFRLFGEDDSGTASRFFNSCKFTKEELRLCYTSKAGDSDRAWSRHPTVKPLELMHWLVRLITPPGGTIIDPFCGSGSTIQAAVEQGFNAVGCEITPEYVADIERRMETFCGWYPRRDPFAISRRPFPGA